MTYDDFYGIGFRVGRTEEAIVDVYRSNEKTYWRPNLLGLWKII